MISILLDKPHGVRIDLVRHDKQRSYVLPAGTTNFWVEEQEAWLETGPACVIGTEDWLSNGPHTFHIWGFVYGIQYYARYLGESDFVLVG